MTTWHRTRPPRAAAVLEPVYESAGAWRELISVHEVQVAHADDPFAKVDLLHRIARLHDGRLELLPNPGGGLLARLVIAFKP